jgi:hypothetical protein
MICTETHTRTYARTELILTQILQTAKKLAPRVGVEGQEAIRHAFDRECFRGISFYGIYSPLGGEEQCYARLRISFDPEVYQTELQLHPRISPGPDWEELIAPELQVVLEQFKRWVIRFGLQVKAHMQVKRGTSTLIQGPLKRALPPYWFGRTVGMSTPIERLEELSIEYVLAEDMEELKRRAPSAKSP